MNAMLKKEELVQVLKYSTGYGYFKSHVKQFLEQEGKDSSDEAVVDAIAERGMVFYYHASPAMREGFDSNPEGVIKMLSKDPNICFKLDPKKYEDDDLDEDLDDYTSASTQPASPARKKALEKERDSKVLCGIVWMIIFFPVGLYNFYRAYQISKEIEKL